MKYKMKLFVNKILKKAKVVGLIRAIFLCTIEKLNFELYKKCIYTFLKETLKAELMEIKDFKVTELQKCEKKFVFVCWWQGEEKCPPIVKRCLQSIRNFCKDYNAIYVLIDDKNYRKWVDLPDIIIKKVGEQISVTEFSDLLRMSLLRRYGGIWIDSTIFYSGKNLYSINPFDQDFFSQKHDVYPDKKVNISEGMWASFIQGTKYYNFPLYVLGEKMYIDYYTKYDTNIDYFVVDYVIRLCYENIPLVKECVDNLPANNQEVFWLYKNAACIEKENQFYNIRKNTMFHKLNWRINLNTDEFILVKTILNVL